MSMSGYLQDLRFALRMLAKNLGFTVIAVLTLALGIGANTALFSVVNGVLLNPLPYWESERLVTLYWHTPQFERSSISYPNFLDWARENHSFSDVAAYRGDNFNLTGTGEPERVSAEMVSASFFPLLGVKPLIGRTFRREEDRLGAGPVVLITEGLWKRRFGSSKDIVGHSITLNGTAYTVIGVIPANFHYEANNFDAQKDVFVPIGQWTDPSFRDRKVNMGMDAVARLKPGVSFEQAKADVDALGQHLAEAYPDPNRGTGITVLPLKQDLVGDIRPFLLVLLAAVGFVLLIACVNVANLLLARSTARIREISVRMALGAGRARIIGQLLAESVLLGIGGGILGLLLAFAGTRAALRLLPEALPRADEIGMDARVLVFTLLISVVTGILFGLVPALKMHDTDLHETLKEGGRGSSGGRHRAQGVFVVVEMALALILLAGTGLMVRSLLKLWSVDPGFDAHNVLTFFISSPTMESSAAAERARWRAVTDKLTAIPGVTAASLSAGAMPMEGDSEVPFWIEGQPKPAAPTEMKQTLFYTVQPDYLKAMRIPLKRGRFLISNDNEHSPPVTVIDDRFAKIAFGNEDPIGKRVNFDVLGVWAEIVGVVGHVNQWGLDSDASASIQAQCYLQMAQVPDRFVPIVSNHLGVVLRSEGPPMSQATSIRRSLQQVNGQMVMFDEQTMENVISTSLAARRFSMALLGIFSGLALVMACVGIYGVIAYLVGQRTHEIGVRMALGADRWDVLRMIVGAGARMAAIGVTIGLIAAFVLTRVMENMLFGISAHDPLTFLAVAFLLIVIAVAATYIPAWRAAKVNPTVALHYE
jgi:predicted permease